ncbi:Uu.00g004530.m01.CDS01 [Anthostomella pinea]|uniref:Uu.00g004530.m01.CDS01 n=1 Tax=Anthostomella pinea TaxID=933095 RepID=A0AAI8VEM6_9PEZI|nr:Uu.00g004530.m01.CDS01 [Anthostomella pinea]
MSSIELDEISAAEEPSTRNSVRGRRPLVDGTPDEQADGPGSHDDASVASQPDNPDGAPHPAAQEGLGAAQSNASMATQVTPVPPHFLRFRRTAFAETITVLSSIIAIIVGFGAWQATNKSNEIGLASYKISAWALYNDHDSIKYTAECRQILGDSLDHLVLEERQLHGSVTHSKSVSIEVSNPREDEPSKFLVLLNRMGVMVIVRHAFLVLINYMGVVPMPSS